MSAPLVHRAKGSVLIFMFAISSFARWDILVRCEHVLPLVILSVLAACQPVNTDCLRLDATCNAGAFFLRGSGLFVTAPLAPISLTASRVYGQGGSFTSATANNPTRNADSIDGAFKPAISGSDVYLADQQNGRILFYPGTSTTATRVYGTGGSYTITGNTGVTSSTFATGGPNVPEVFADSTGIYVSDINGHRVLFFPGTATTASRVYGQFGVMTNSFSNNNNAGGSGVPSAGNLNNPQGIFADATGVYIADTNNHRILFYPTTSTTATRVYGQGGSFTTGNLNQGGRSADSLAQPRGIWVDAEGVYVAEVQNNRVLFYPGTSTTATRVYGQNGNFTTNVTGTSATTLNAPWFVTTFAGKVCIADSGNFRILEFDGTSTTASRVWGQNGSMTSGVQNLNGVSAASLDAVYGLAVDATGMYAADGLNHRMLFFSR